jgi:hypothetical protein
LIAAPEEDKIIISFGFVGSTDAENNELLSITLVKPEITLAIGSFS